MAKARDEVAVSFAELRDLARGPAVLSALGLAATLESLTGRASASVQVMCSVEPGAM